MSLLESIFSGILQGITEFLPVSSSGHLVLLHDIFGIKESTLCFDILLHLATLLAVIIYFSGDIADLFRKRDYKLIGFLITGTIPAVFAGFFLEDFFDSFFSKPSRVGYMFFITAAFLISAEFSLRVNRKTGSEKIDFLRSILIGFAQALALIPGISRSGTTISTSLLCGIPKKEAFNFSFLLSIPVILGAAIYKMLTADPNTFLNGNWLIYFAGMLTAFLSGMICLKLLWWFVKTSRLYIFAVYCIFLGTISLFFKL